MHSLAHARMLPPGFSPQRNNSRQQAPGCEKKQTDRSNDESANGKPRSATSGAVLNVAHSLSMALGRCVYCHKLFTIQSVNGACLLRSQSWQEREMRPFLDQSESGHIRRDECSNCVSFWSWADSTFDLPGTQTPRNEELSRRSSCALPGTQAPRDQESKDCSIAQKARSTLIAKLTMELSRAYTR